MSAETPDPFLDLLTGRWTLTGTMGTTELRQKVEAGWVLRGRFLRMRFVQDGPGEPGRPPYEAIYLLGHDPDADEYVLHLFDTFGMSSARTVGIGKKDGNSVEFLFDYPDGPLSNTFTWDRGRYRWEMRLRQRGRGGEWTDFATKTLTRA